MSPPAPGHRRVLHGYAGNLFGGIETLLVTLARGRALEPSLVQEFALCFRGRLARELKDAGATVHDLGEVRFRQPWTILRARRRFRRLLATGAGEVVVTHSCWPHALLGPVARRAGRPLVFWMHDAVGRGHWLERLAARTPPDLVVANSRHTVATLPGLFPGARAEVLYCPVARAPEGDRAAARAEVRRELATDSGAVAIIQVSRLERWKGQTLLIEALGRLRDRPGWVAWIVGGAQRPHEEVYLEELRGAAAAAGIGDRVRFLGQRADVPRLLAAADVHCQPNIGPEPFGISFIEALYAGLPVVSTRLGGAVEIVTDDCGVLVTPGDPTSLAAALEGLMADPGTRARLGSAGPARAVELCDPGATLGRLRGLLSDLDSPRSTARRSA